MGLCIYVIPPPMMRVVQPVPAKAKAAARPALLGPRIPRTPTSEPSQGSSPMALAGGSTPLAIQDGTPSSSSRSSVSQDADSQAGGNRTPAVSSQGQEQSQEPEAGAESPEPEQEQEQEQEPEAGSLADEEQPVHREAEGEYIPPLP